MTMRDLLVRPRRECLRAAVLGLLLVWLFFCVKGGLGRRPAPTARHPVMAVPDDVPPPKPSADEDYINNALKDPETAAL